MPTSISQSPSLAPKVFRFSDIDEFRSWIRNVDVDFTPLVRKISAEQVILNLPGWSINFIKSFPRIVDARLAPNCTAIGVAMDEGIPTRFNGVEQDQPFIMIGNNGAAYNAVEHVERQFALIVFTPQIEGRGWPEAGPNFRIFETSAPAQRRLRTLVAEILAAARRFSEAELADAAPGMRESLVGSIDAAFADVVPARWASRANSVRQFKIFQAVREALSANITGPIYSRDVARQLGVPVRTIHDAVLRYRGMSLHRYLRLRRLWLVRQRLRAGTHSVKAAALALGFWHLSDFAHSYRVQFGETPSETLARARNS